SGRSQTPDPVQFRKVCKALGISSIDAAIALGFITREEVNQSISLSPDLAEIVDVFTDPRIPASEKRYILEYLLWRRDRSRSTTAHTIADYQRRRSFVSYLPLLRLPRAPSATKLFSAKPSARIEGNLSEEFDGEACMRTTSMPESATTS